MRDNGGADSGGEARSPSVRDDDGGSGLPALNLRLLAVLVAALVVAIDQATKAWAVEALADGQPEAAIRRSEIELRRTNFAEATGEYPSAIAAAEAAIAAAETAIELAREAGAEQAQSEAVHLEAEGYLQWGRVLWRQGE